MNDFLKLQNGSDIRGVAIGNVPGEDVNLTEREAIAIGAAFTYWLGNKVHKNVFDLKICIGNDPRLSADELKRGLAKGICYLGSSASDAGLASTPAMFMSTVMPYFDFDGAIMITASHLPQNRNGFKFFTAEGGLDKADITEILHKAATLHVMPDFAEMRQVNVMDMYAAHLRMLISSRLKGDLQGLKVAVDAGNGAAGFFADKVLAPLGADVSASMFLEPDGSFPNHQPNPENKAAMQAICEQVVRTGADLGLIFDTDVDRSAAVTAQGAPISRNEIVALAASLVADEHPGGTIVTDSITSNELHSYLENELGLHHLRYKRGYKNVINKAKELAADGTDAFLAIETSGHAAYAENYYLDDGAYLAVLIVIAAAQLKKKGSGIDALIAELDSPAESEEIRLKIDGDDFVAIGTALLQSMTSWVAKTSGLSLEEPNYEGVRVNYDIDGHTGWFLLRKSLHDPVLPLNMESTTTGGLAKIKPLIFDFISQCPEISLQF